MSDGFPWCMYAILLSYCYTVQICCKCCFDLWMKPPYIVQICCIKSAGILWIFIVVSYLSARAADGQNPRAWPPWQRIRAAPNWQRNRFPAVSHPFCPKGTHQDLKTAAIGCYRLLSISTSEAPIIFLRPIPPNPPGCGIWRQLDLHRDTRCPCRNRGW